jgi:hypothetical protein
MAKGKERPTAAPKAAAGPRSPVSKPAAAPSSAKSRVDAPAPRPAGGIAVNPSGSSVTKLSPEEIYKLIQESAYFKAKARGFAPGHEVQDWIEAEAEVRRRLDDRAS